MEIINVKAFKKERATGLPLLRVMKNKVAFSKEAITLLYGDDLQPKSVDIEFGQQEGQLHVRAVSLPSDTSVPVKFQNNGCFELYNKGFSNYLKDVAQAKNETGTIQMRIVENAIEDNWHPVITSYWKTLKK